MKYFAILQRYFRIYLKDQKFVLPAVSDARRKRKKNRKQTKIFCMHINGRNGSTRADGVSRLGRLGSGQKQALL